MMPVLQGYTNDGLLMNNFGPESDWRHKHKLLLSLLLYYPRFSIQFLSSRVSNSSRPKSLELETGDLQNVISYIKEAESVYRCVDEGGRTVTAVYQVQWLFRVGCFGEYDSVGWISRGWVGRGSIDCGLFECTVPHFSGGVKHSNENVNHCRLCHRRTSHQTLPKCVSEVLPLQKKIVWRCN